MGKTNNVFLKFERTNYKGKTAIVYEQLKKAIMEGMLKPGDKLESDQIAAALNVSRMPVREAIKRLELEGLADVIPHKEVRVAFVTKDQVKDVFALRVVIEALAVREAALHIDADGIERLWDLCRKMEQLVAKGDTGGQLIRNREFHELIYEISGNKVLQVMAANLFDSIERYRLQFMSTPRKPFDVLSEHKKLTAAIEAHDPNLAEVLMRTHIEKTGKIMLGYASDAPSPSERKTGRRL